MHRLAERGYRGSTFSAAVRDDPPGRTVAITFDDAYPSVVRHALPVLESLGWPATVFAPTATVPMGGHMAWLSGDLCRRLPEQTRQMTWPELTSLAEAGWEIGSHSRTHRMLSSLSDDELQEELEGSRAEIAQELGSCVSIGYPWGEIDSRVLEASRRAGYETGSGLAGRFVYNDPLQTPRVPIAGVDGGVRMALKTSGLLWTLRASPLWSALEVARGLGRPPQRSATRFASASGGLVEPPMTPSPSGGNATLVT